MPASPPWAHAGSIDINLTLIDINFGLIDISFGFVHIGFELEDISFRRESDERLVCLLGLPLTVACLEGKNKRALFGISLRIR